MSEEVKLCSDIIWENSLNHPENIKRMNMGLEPITNHPDIRDQISQDIAKNATKSSSLKGYSWSEDTLQTHKEFGDVVYALQYQQIKIPAGNYQLPKTYIDPNLLRCKYIDYLGKEVITADTFTEDDLMTCIVPLDYSEGFPTVDGLPFWERLDGETIDDYKLFKTYREMKYNTVQEKRSLVKTSEVTGVPVKVLKVIQRTQHWLDRVTAYDIYKDNELEMEKQIQRRKLQEGHVSKATELLEMAFTQLMNHPEALDSKEAINLFEKCVHISRVSVGLYKDKPGETVPQKKMSDNAENNKPVINMWNYNGPGHQELSETTATVNDAPVSAIDEAMRNQDNSQLGSILKTLNESGAFATEAGIIDPNAEEWQKKDDIQTLYPEMNGYKENKTGKVIDLNEA